jgi:hypothetical protein
MNAFPVALPAGFEGYEEGMMLRDYFAGQALIGWLADGKPSDAQEAAHQAYVFADAMLAAREKSK